MFLLPALIPFLSISCTAITLMWGALRSFNKIEEKIKNN